MSGLHIFVAVFLVLFVSAVKSADLHNIYDCPEPSNVKSSLLDKPISVEGKWFGVQSRTLMFPDTEINVKNITCIRVKDLDANGKGGYPSIVDGGVGYYDVTIHFITQKGRGMHFRVQIFGD